MSKQLPTPKASDGPNGGPRMRNGRGQVDALPAVTDFGPYTDAIRRHEDALGRPAPSPTEPGTNGPRLSPAFVEWMMMLPHGHVTDPAIGLSRSQQLKALGNGVVPAQAAHALRWLLELDAPESADDTRLLPTPTSQAAKHGSLAPVEREGNRPQDDCNLWVVAARMGESLLPTPTPFQLENRETPGEWLARRKDVVARTKTHHGLPLPVAAVSISEGKPILLSDPTASEQEWGVTDV